MTLGEVAALRESLPPVSHLRVSQLVEEMERTLPVGVRFVTKEQMVKIAGKPVAGHTEFKGTLHNISILDGDRSLQAAILLHETGRVVFGDLFARADGDRAWTDEQRQRYTEQSEAFAYFYALRETRARSLDASLCCEVEIVARLASDEKADAEDRIAANLVERSWTWHDTISHLAQLRSQMK